MRSRPPFDRSLLIPIAMSVVLMLGIGWILSTTDLRVTLFPATAVPTASPFDDHSLETRVASFYPSPTSTQDETPPTTTETQPNDADPEPLDETLPSRSTLIAESLPAPSATPIPGQVQPLSAGQYDDTDSRIAYDRFWTALKNPGTANAYKGTLHASNSIGNEASFRFTGAGFLLGYQRGMNFGTVTVVIDDQSYSFHEEDFALVWRSPPLSPGEHFVRIIHESGESINLDYIVILD